MPKNIFDFFSKNLPLGNFLLSFFLYTYVRRLVIRYGDGSTYLKPSSEIMKRFAILDVFLNGVNLWKKKCLSFEVEAKGVCRGGGGVGPAKRGDPGWAPAGSGTSKARNIKGVSKFFIQDIQGGQQYAAELNRRRT